MERIFSYTITDADAGKDIHEFLRGKKYSRHILASMKPDKTAILVNGVHEFMCYRLQTGDVLQTRVVDPVSSVNIRPAPVPFSVIYEDEDVLIVDKPAGQAIHPAISHPADTLANGLAWYYQQQGIPFVVRCINRLDRDTTGLLIVAKNLVSACVLEQDLLARKIHRTYLAIAEGELSESGTIDLPIARKEGSLIERCVDPEHGDRAVTHFMRKEYYPPVADTDNNFACRRNGFSLVQLKLETGRTHQIRVHLSHSGHPLVGDTLYNPDFFRTPEDPIPEGLPMNRQALHSWQLDFTHPITGEAMHFEAPVPEDMRKLLRGD
uniref:RluA family pseudouridine synthase n=1 Tax=Eubacterium cellulosolvens TaxID=29322 RepID=UPI0004860839|nr:RluA family pseudouridine synthase [[Eubacterium] cellulosolvens]